MSQKHPTLTLDTAHRREVSCHEDAKKKVNQEREEGVEGDIFKLPAGENL